ncbi:MAG: GNAT family N-acetyltransferase [Nocardioides sp.]
MKRLVPESIREADAEDLVALFGGAGPFVSARQLSDYWLYARLFGSTCLCLRIEGRPIAVVIALRDQSNGAHEIYVQDVAVAPEYRRRGYAVTLLDELRRRAGGWGIRRLWLTSEAANTDAVRLWTTLGYVNTKADYQQDGLWLTKDLKGPGRDRAVFDLLLTPADHQ